MIDLSNKYFRTESDEQSNRLLRIAVAQGYHLPKGIAVLTGNRIFKFTGFPYKAVSFPENISAVCHDLNMDIARHFHVSDREAFDMSREQIMNDLCGPEDIVTGNKHNSLYDAEVIRAIWKEIH